MRKRPIYARWGVPWLWLVEPEAQTLEVMRLMHERWALVGGFAADNKVRAEPFDAIELDLAAFWLPQAAPA